MAALTLEKKPALSLTKTCECGNRLPDAFSIECVYCEMIAMEPPHAFRRTMSGIWCVTCDSPYCELI